MFATLLIMIVYRNYCDLKSNNVIGTVTFTEANIEVYNLTLS